MAMLPCDFGKHRFPEKIAHLYPALLDGSQTRRASLRACPRHAQFVLDQLDGLRYDMDQPYAPVPSNFHICLTCHNYVDGEASSFFLTAYIPGQERADYAGTLHRNCLPPDWSLLPTS